MPPSKGLITIAIGKKHALQAKYLAYSCMLHTPNSIRAVITDIPDFLKGYYDIIIPYNPEYENPFTLKLKLYLYTPFDQTLFIDADSLVLHPIDMYWDFLTGHTFVYEGKILSEGFWYFDIEKTAKQIDVPWIPKFNSGMFLFKKDELSQSIFAAASNYLENGGGFDIPFFREKMLPDEPFFAMALAKYALEPVKEYGRFSKTLIGAKKIHINILRGIGYFIKDDMPVFPLIVHFCGRFGRFLLFWESLKLHVYFNPPVSTFVINAFSMIRKLFKK
jgi:hypothetical protein